MKNTNGKSLAASVKAQSVKTQSAKVEKATSRWFDVKQGYRAFKGIDATAYNLQGELTICALRSARVAEVKESARGTSIALFKGAQGQAAMIGKIGKIDGEDCIQSGNFALSLKTKGFVKTFASLSDFAKFIVREGEQGEKYSANLKGLRVLVGSKYSFTSDGKGVWRWEAGTCARGAKYFASTF